MKRLSVVILILVIAGAISLHTKMNRRSLEASSNDTFNNSYSFSSPGNKAGDHEKDASIIHETGKFIRLGNSHYAVAEYDQAMTAYRRAYSLDKGSRAVSGLKLALTYEHLKRYKEGIDVLNQMIEDRVLSENGIKNAEEIKARLLIKLDR